MERFVPTLSERTTRYVLYLCGFLCFAIGGQSVFLTVYRGYGTGRSAIFAGGAFYLFGVMFWWLAYRDSRRKPRRSRLSLTHKS